MASLARLMRRSISQPAVEAERSRLAGRMGQLKGQDTERSVLHALLLFLNTATCPTWLLGARACTEREDRAGVDIVLSTTRGPLHLQVKASRAALGGDRRYYENRGIVVVISNKKTLPTPISVFRHVANTVESSPIWWARESR